ncbi:MAG TPA: hypothetical protein VIE16_04715 [Phenylobacterium sp.]|jgi:hypothetical protein
MSEQVQDDVQSAEPAAQLNGEDATGELVHWMEPKPLRVGPAGATAIAVGGFALGVGATLAALALADWLSPDREIVVRRARD